MAGDEHDIVVERDLVYATVGGAELRLDIYRSAGPDAPVVVYAHGGGWIRGDKVEDGAKRLGPLRAYGVTARTNEHPRTVSKPRVTHIRHGLDRVGLHHTGTVSPEIRPQWWTKAAWFAGTFAPADSVDDDTAGVGP